MESGKPIVYIYVNPASESTKRLDQFLAEHIDQINEHLFVKRIKVTSKNVSVVKSRGITVTPTLVYNNKKIASLEKIFRILTPPAKQKDHYGYGNMSADDLINQYQSGILDSGDEEEDTEMVDKEMRGQQLRQRMAAMQKRRPEMNGVDEKKKLGGGRKVKAVTPAKSKFDTDEEFKRASNLDNIIATPAVKYMEDEDGASILEDYYLNEAFNSGKKVGKTVSKRR